MLLAVQKIPQNPTTVSTLSSPWSTTIPHSVSVNVTTLGTLHKGACTVTTGLFTLHNANARFTHVALSEFPYR